MRTIGIAGAIVPALSLVIASPAAAASEKSGMTTVSLDPAGLASSPAKADGSKKEKKKRGLLLVVGGLAVLAGGLAATGSGPASP